jgi:hypothetical protein
MKTSEQRHNEYVKYRERKAMKSSAFNHTMSKIMDDETGVYDDSSGCWFQGYISALVNHKIINEKQFDALLAVILERQ